MDFRSEHAELFVPDGLAADAALARTTHLGIAAHQDDLEIMAIDGILRCFQREDRWFTGVIVTDGAGSARSGPYGDYTDEQMKVVRAKEQKKAALIGEFAAAALLAYPSTTVKSAKEPAPIEDLQAIIRACRAETIYTHNLADKHPTHVAVVMRVIEALRGLPAEFHPKHLYGCEVWRDLGWTLDKDKVVFDCSAHDNLQNALVGVFDSQVIGGKRYDYATMGRRRANATYFESHGVDTATGLAFAMDLTPLITDPSTDVIAFIQSYIDRFSQDVHHLLSQVQ
jgi:LmbE family N-acetylglucosaminyl deacetylase